MLNDTADVNYFYRWQNNSLATVGFSGTSGVIQNCVLQSVNVPSLVPFPFLSFFFFSPGNFCHVSEPLELLSSTCHFSLGHQLSFLLLCSL